MKKNLYALFLLTIISSSLKSQTPDNSFNGDGKTVLPAYSEYEECTSAFLQSDNKIVLGGYDYDETFYYPAMSIWRVLPNGAVDSSFGNGGHVRISGSPFGGSEYGGYVALQPDKKIVGAGTDFDRDGNKKGHIVLFRLKANGTYDSSFGTNGKAYANLGGFTNITESFLLKAEGKMVVGGRLYKNNGNTAELIQFLPNGQIDSSFGVNGVVATKTFYKEALALALSSDNKIIAAYKYTQNNIIKTGLAKYNNDGTIDKSFGSFGGVSNNGNQVDTYTKIALYIQPDGKILEYTSSSSYESPSGKNVIFRYNANGSIDRSFGTAGYVYAPQTNTVSISIKTDNMNRILVNTPDFGILRYLSNGTLDSSFGVSGKVSVDYNDSIPGAYVRSEQILVQPDTKVIALGYFDSFDGLQEFMLARFKNVDGLQTTPVVNAVKTIAVYPNPVQNNLFIKGFDATKSYSISITDRSGNVKAVKQITNSSLANLNVQKLQAGTYFIAVVSGETKVGLQFIKQ